MAGLTTVIFTNGVVQSTYDNGTPADKFSGKLPVLYNIFRNIKDKTLLPVNEKLTKVSFYISNDPLCINKIEVSQDYLEHILQYLKYDFQNIPIEQQKDIDINNMINKANQINENLNFNLEKE
jgi:hypothetical protein